MSEAAGTRAEAPPAGREVRGLARPGGRPGGAGRRGADGLGEGRGAGPLRKTPSGAPRPERRSPARSSPRPWEMGSAAPPGSMPVRERVLERPPGSSRSFGPGLSGCSVQAEGSLASGRRS